MMKKVENCNLNVEEKNKMGYRNKLSNEIPKKETKQWKKFEEILSKFESKEKSKNDCIEIMVDYLDKAAFESIKCGCRAIGSEKLKKG
jgi:hypothetical protein